MDALTFPVSVFSFSVFSLESVSDSPLESDSGSSRDSVLKDGVCFINFLSYRVSQIHAMVKVSTHISDSWMLQSGLSGISSTGVGLLSGILSLSISHSNIN